MGTTGEVRMGYAAVIESVDGVIVRVKDHADIDEGRAGAERFAEARG